VSVWSALGAIVGLAGVQALASRERRWGSRAQVPWAPFTQRWGAAGGVPVGSRLPLGEIFRYWTAMTNMNPDDAAAYFELFSDKPTWELRMVDPWVIESYSEPGRIQSDAGLDEERWAVEYAERGTVTAPPVVLFEYEGDDPGYAFLTSDGTHRSRAALLEGRWIQAWVPADAPMRASTVEPR
jgi:hypothetical protein